MRKIILSIFLVLFFLILSGCHLFEREDNLDDVAIFFSDTNVTIMKGGLAAFSLRVEPADALGYNDVNYSVSNELVAQIYKADRRGVTVSGRAAGSTVITAKIGNAEAKAVVNVVE